MLVCNQAYAAFEYTGLSDNLIQSGEEHRPNPNGGSDQGGADYETFLSTLNSSFYSSSNSFTMFAQNNFTDGAGNDKGENDVGTSYGASTPLGTTNSQTYFNDDYSDNWGSTGDVAHTSNSQSGSSYYETTWNIVGGGSAWQWTVGQNFEAYQEVGGTTGTNIYSNSYFSSGSGTGSGEGTSPPKGVWNFQTTINTTVSLGGLITYTTDSTREVITGTSITVGTAGTQTVPTTTTVSDDIETTFISFSQITYSAKTITDSTFYDPYGFYLYQKVYVPESDVVKNDWVWILDYVPGITDGLFTDFFYSIEDERTYSAVQDKFIERVQSILDGNVDFPDWTWSKNAASSLTFNSIVYAVVTADTYGNTGLSFGASTDTRTRYGTGGAGSVTGTGSTASSTDTAVLSLPMFSYAETWTWQPTDNSIVSVQDTAVTLGGSAVNEAPSHTISVINLDYATETIFSSLSDSVGPTTISWSVLRATGSLGTQTVDDINFVFSQVVTSPIGTMGGYALDAVYEVQTRTEIQNTGLSFGPWPDFQHFDQFQPTLTDGFQIQSDISNTDDVVQGVGANQPISIFNNNFYNLAVIGGASAFFYPYLHGGISIPYQFFYTTPFGYLGANTIEITTVDTSTNSSTLGTYSFSFDSTGGLSVSYLSTDVGTKTFSTFTVSLYPIGSTESSKITNTYGTINPAQQHFQLLGYPIVGGPPAAGGINTVYLSGVFATTDNLNSSGIETLTGNDTTFEMATDELSVFQSLPYYTARSALVNTDYNQRPESVYISVFDKYPPVATA